MAILNQWQSTNPPFVQLLVLDDGQSHDQVITAPPDTAVCIIRGEKCRTKDGLLSEFARVLNFPPYFGENWDALDDCLTDLAWLPAAGYLVIITEAEQLLHSSREDYQIFISLLQNVGKEWATPRTGEWPRPATPFHILLTVAEEQKTKHKDWGVPLLNRINIFKQLNNDPSE